MVELSEQGAVMPDLTTTRYGFHHTVDSALVVLARLDIAPERITIRKAGRGWVPLRVIEQDPPPKTELRPHVLIELVIEGDGFFEHLPVGMREEPEKENEFGTRHLAALFDDPVEKAAHFARQGGLYFDVRPENLPGCARWIQLFGLAPDTWPCECWYRLALLLPQLRHWAGRQKGLRLALRLLAEVEVRAIAWRARQTLWPPGEQSRLGERTSQLGVDLIVGDGVDDEAALEITLGPLTLEEYAWQQSLAGQQLLQQVLRLVLPYHWDCEVNWLVGDVTCAPRLGVAAENAVLGVNSHLGTS